MPFKSTKDKEFGDCYFDVFKTDMRLIRAALKTYEMTRKYAFLKLFKKATDDYEFEQRISLTLGEFENVVSSSSKIQNSVADQQSAAEPPLVKKPKNQKNLSTTMVEAMFERSPNYFKQFQKHFKLLIVEEKPSFSIGNFYAVCAHIDSEFCNLVNSHYHVLIDTTTFEN